MTDMIDPSVAHDDPLEQDPEFRREVCERSLERARERQLPISNRALSLLKRYEAGEFSIEEFEGELMRPHLH